jgi:hypothetical protein
MAWSLTWPYEDLPLLTFLTLALKIEVVCYCEILACSQNTSVFSLPWKSQILLLVLMYKLYLYCTQRQSCTILIHIWLPEGRPLPLITSATITNCCSCLSRKCAHSALMHSGEAVHWPCYRIIPAHGKCMCYTFVQNLLYLCVYFLIRDCGEHSL